MIRWAGGSGGYPLYSRSYQTLAGRTEGAHWTISHSPSIVLAFRPTGFVQPLTNIFQKSTASVDLVFLVRR